MTKTFKPMTAVGLMSGTSADGIDAAILVTDGESYLVPKGGITIPYADDFKARLIEVASTEVPESEIEQTEAELTRLHADAVKLACSQVGVAPADIGVVGFHGHTIRHQPDQGITRQIGDGQLLARLTQQRVVFDFRSADMAAGGQGAPFAPLYHQAVLGDRPETHLILNLGGVGNITWIQGDQIVAGDTGPGCGLLDSWVQAKTGELCDRDGQFAQKGTVDQNCVEEMLTTIPFFDQPFPKSADRYDFAAIDVSRLSLEDGAATLCAITVESVARAVSQLDAWPEHCWVTGGGRHHPLLMKMLSEKFSCVAGISDLGHSGDFLEAECFAWLAVRRLRDLPTSQPSTTGVQQPISGGQVVS